MLIKLFWALLVISLALSFIYKDQLKSFYINKFLDGNKKSAINNLKNDEISKGYDIVNLTSATGTSITLKDKEYIYNFIKRLESYYIQGGEIEKNEGAKYEKLKVMSVFYDNYGDVYLHLDNGEIRLNIFNDLDTVWNDYLSAIGDAKLSYKLKNERDNLDYLDLRFPNKLFYRFKNTSTSTNIKIDNTSIKINQYDQRILGTSTISSSTAQ